MKKLTVILLITLVSCNEVTHSKLGIENAKSELKNTLADSSNTNYVDNKRVIIENESTAISVAEPILFGIYGKSHILDQKPYEAYLIDNYWVINGTLNRFSFGGTFLIIIDARNAKVLKIIHGK